MVVPHDDNRVPFRPPERQAMLRERGLRASEERMRRSLEAAGLGHWDYDYVSETLVWSEQTRKLLGVEPGGPASRPRLRSRAHPRDRPRLEEHIARSAHLDADHIRHFGFRVVMPNGAIRWLEDQDRVETSAAGMPVRAVGVLRDVTERKSAEGGAGASCRHRDIVCRCYCRQDARRYRHELE
jgi:PAS domain S-box-containing protein